MSQVAVIDYGRGNLYSIGQALRTLGCEADLVSAPHKVMAAERVILPGVGAFGDGMAGLRARGLVEPLREYAASGRPLLGICLGMQLLLDESSEFGRHQGLSIVPGKVVRLPEEAGFKVPHVGWSRLVPESSWEGTILAGMPREAFMYFVHSYVAEPVRPADRLASTVYGANRFCSVLRSGNVQGCQFHPEKSAAGGLRMLANFVHPVEESVR